MLHTQYRTQLNFSFQGLYAVKTTLARIHDFMVRVDAYKAPQGVSWARGEAVLKDALTGFAHALSQDLNISEALSFLFELIREVNGALDVQALGAQDVDAVKSALQQIDSVLGICSFTEEAIPQEIQDLVDMRQKARKEKEWKRSDELRDLLHQKGYTLEDGPTGVRVKKS